jgi:hypothetical protein
MFDIERLVWENFMSGLQFGRDTEPLGPSGAGNCIRAEAYAQLGVQPTNEQSTLQAEAGTLIHMGIMAALDGVPGVRTEVPLRLPQWGRAGSADIVYDPEYLLIDVKTYNGRSYERRVEAGEPYEHQWDQVEQYGLALYEAAGDGHLWTLQILGVNRDTGEHTVWEKVQDLDRARAVAERIRSRQDSIDEAKARLADPTSSVTAIQLAETFPREGNGPGRGFPCDPWCPFLEQCWPAPFDLGLLSAQAATVVSDPEEVARWAAEYREASALAKAANDRKYTAQAYLQGITGEFGGWQVAQVGSGRSTEVPDVDAMIDLLAAHGEAVPMLTKPGRKPYPRVRKVRD